MANLIITIIAIALVAVAALMGAYYGGTAFNQGQDKAAASAIMNQAAQIQAAAQMWAVDNSGAITAIANLTTANAAGDKYLASVPTFKGQAWTLVGSVATLDTDAITADVCTELQRQVGTGGAWTCVSTSGAEEITYTF